MDNKREWYIRVFGFEAGCGGEQEMARRVGRLAGVVSVSWHDASQGLCVRLDGQGDVADVAGELRRGGYVPLPVRDACACCAS